MKLSTLIQVGSNNLYYRALAVVIFTLMMLNCVDGYAQSSLTLKESGVNSRDKIFYSTYLPIRMIKNRTNKYKETIQQMRNSSFNLFPTGGNWAFIETGEDVYNYELIDKAINYITKKSDTGILFYGTMWNGPPKWFLEKYKGQQMLDNHGNVQGYRFKQSTDHKILYGNYPSIYSKVFRKKYKRFISTLINRYKNNNNIKIWQFNPGQMEVIYLDRCDRVFDYSEHARKAFIEYLGKDKKLNLSEVNRRYNENNASMADIQLPRPMDRKGKIIKKANGIIRYYEDYVIDFRQKWKDFNEFKQKGIVDWYREVIEEILRNDKTRKIRINIGQSVGAIDDIASMLSEYPNVYGGFASMERLPAAPLVLSLYKLNNLFAIGENGAIPVSKYSFNGSIFNAVYFGNQNGFMWVHTNNNPSVYKTIGNFPPERFNEIKNLKIKHQDKVGVLFSFDTQFLTQNSFFALGWNRAAIEKSSSFFMLNHYNYQFLSDHSDKVDYSQYKIILAPDAVVLKKEIINKLEKYVYKGGKLFLTADSIQAMYEYTKKKIDYPLLKQTGLELEKISETKEDEAISLHKIIKVNNIKLRKRISFKIKKMKPGIKIVKKNGSPLLVSYKYGKGEILFLAGALNYEKNLAPLYKAIMKWAKVTPVLKAPNTLRALIAYSQKNVPYIILFNELKGTNELTIKIDSIKDAKYNAVNLTSVNKSIYGKYSAEDFSKGVKFKLGTHELLVLKLVENKEK